MKIILLQDVKTLGKKGEIIEANDGYARNYILPKKIGVEANAKNMKEKAEEFLVRFQQKKLHRLLKNSAV